MQLTKIAQATALGGLLVLGAGAAHAGASISSQIFDNEINKLSDNDGEGQCGVVTVNGGAASTCPGAGDVGPAGPDGYLFNPGDTLRGTNDWNSLEDITGGGGVRPLGAGTVNELSSIFQTEVISATIVFDTDGSCGGDLVNCDTGGGIGSGLSGDEVADYVFGPSAAFAAEFGANPGTMFVFYDDNLTGGGTKYDRTLSTQGAIEATATGGTVVMHWGIYGLDADESWKARGPVDTTAPAFVPLDDPLGAFSFALSIDPTTNLLFKEWGQVLAGCNNPLNLNFPCAGDGLIDVNAQGQILGTALAPGFTQTSFYDAFSNVDANFAPIPEPGSIALLSLGLVGLAAGMRRRKVC